MSEQNKTVVRRLFEELWNKGTLPVADELIAPTYTHHDTATPDVGRGPESEKKRVTMYRNAFADFRLTIEDIIAEGETVMARWTCRGAQRDCANGQANLHLRSNGCPHRQWQDCRRLGQLGRAEPDAAAWGCSGTRQQSQSRREVVFSAC
jgi:ketosteroid isomerase-like protein